MNEISELISRLNIDPVYEFESFEREEETLVVTSWSHDTRVYQRHLFDLDGNYIDSEPV